MLFLNILLIIYCVYTAAFSSGTLSSAHQLINTLEATHQTWVFVSLLFYGLGGGEACSLDTSSQNGGVKD